MADRHREKQSGVFNKGKLRFGKMKTQSAKSLMRCEEQIQGLLKLLACKNRFDLIVKATTDMHAEDFAEFTMEMFEVLEGFDWRIFRTFILEGLTTVDKRFGNRFQKRIYKLNGGQYLKN